MKKMLFSLLIAAGLHAQIGTAPPNGSTLPWQQPTPICWQYGGQYGWPNLDAVFLQFQLPTGQYINAYGGEYVPPVSCLNFTPTTGMGFNTGQSGFQVILYGYVNDGNGGLSYTGYESIATYYVVVPGSGNTYTGGNNFTGGAALAQPATLDDYPSPGVGATSYWSADDTSADSVAGNNGNWMYGSGYTTGHINQAFSFGGSYFMQLSGSTAISGARSWVFWVNPGSGCMPIIATGQAGQGDLISVCNGQAMIESVQNGSDNQSYGPALPAGQWSHLGVVYDGGSNLTFYINGNVAGTYYLSLNNGFTMAQTYFGANPVGGTITGGIYTGALDEVYYYNSALPASGVQTLYTAQMAKRTLETHLHVKTAQGVVDVKRGDLIDIGDFSYRFSEAPGGQWKYTYQLDNHEVGHMRLGYVTDRLMDITSTTQPKGWGGGYGRWHAVANPEYSATATYSVTSTRAPGLVPMYFQGDVMGFVAAANNGPAEIGLPLGRTKDNEALAKAVNIYNNSVLKWVIGPVFPPGTSKEEAIAKVKTWVNDYGVAFLEPLLRGKTLAELSPSTPLEQDIVKCLARFLK